MNKKVIEYFDRYLGGQLNEETSDDMIDKAVVDLILLTEKVCEYFGLDEISGALARRVRDARKTIRKNIDPSLHKNAGDARKVERNRDKIGQTKYGQQLIRKSSPEHMDWLNRMVRQRSPGTNPNQSKASQRDLGYEKLKTASSEADQLRNRLVPDRLEPSAPVPKTTKGEKIGSGIGTLVHKDINPFPNKINAKNTLAALKKFGKNLKKGYNTKVEPVGESTRREEEEEESRKSDPTGYISMARQRQYEPIRKVEYPGSSTKQLGKDNVFQSQIGTGMHGKTIRGKVDRGPSVEPKDSLGYRGFNATISKKIARETQSAASNVDDVISSLPRRDKDIILKREKMGQKRFDFDHPKPRKPQEKKEKSLVTKILPKSNVSSAGQRSREVESQRINTSQSQRDRRRETNKTRDDSKSQR